MNLDQFDDIIAKHRGAEGDLDSLVSPGGRLHNEYDAEEVVSPSGRIEQRHLSGYTFGSEADARSMHRQAGVGLVFSMDDHDENVLVKSIERGSPAWRDGKIKIGDALIRVEDRPVRGQTLGVVRSWVLGEPGSTVVLSFRRIFRNTDPAKSPETSVFEAQLYRGSVTEGQTAQMAKTQAELQEVREALRAATAQLHALQRSNHGNEQLTFAIGDNTRLEPTLELLKQERARTVEEQEKAIQLTTDRNNAAYLAKSAELREKSSSASLLEEQKRCHKLEARAAQVQQELAEQQENLTKERAAREKVEAQIKDAKYMLSAQKDANRKCQDRIRDLEAQMQQTQVQEEQRKKEFNLWVLREQGRKEVEAAWTQHVQDKEERNRLSQSQDQAGRAMPSPAFAGFRGAVSGGMSLDGGSGSLAPYEYPTERAVSRPYTDSLVSSALGDKAVSYRAGGGAGSGRGSDRGSSRASAYENASYAVKRSEVYTTTTTTTRENVAAADEYQRATAASFGLSAQGAVATSDFVSGDPSKSAPPVYDL